MSLTAEASEGSDTILIRGQTASHVTDITFSVVSPDGFNRLAVDQITPDANGYFSTEFKLSPLWKQNGFYTITAMQSVHANSLYTMSVMVEVVNGITMETLVTESNLETGIFVPELEQLSLKGLTMRANAVEGSTTIGIVGHSDRTNIDITLKVIAPNGNVVSVEQITADLDGKFAIDITTGGPLWTQDGIYTVTAQQGESPNHKASVEVEIVDGVVIPEFGAIAALILAIAIISIIIVSSKSRLSIMPRY
jgi:predicted secreted protein with PEFG-CTERM motif